MYNEFHVVRIRRKTEDGRRKFEDRRPKSVF